MATNQYQISVADGWVEVASADEDYLIEVTAPGYCVITQQDGPPSADAAFHVLQNGRAFVRVGTGALYVAARYQSITVVVTT